MFRYINNVVFDGRGCAAAILLGWHCDELSFLLRAAVQYIGKRLYIIYKIFFCNYQLLYAMRRQRFVLFPFLIQRK